MVKSNQDRTYRPQKPSATEVIEMEELKISGIAGLVPERKADANKGDFGTLLCVCGSARYRGAATISCEAALRCGVGIVRLASVEKVCAAVAASVPEATFLPQNEGADGEISGFNAARYFELNPKTSAVLCGCGLTVTPETRNEVLDLIENAPCAIVLDADALNCIKSDPSVLRRASKTPVITPHWGEFARLCGRTVEEISRDPEKEAADFAAANGCVVVLKSHFTVIASPDGKRAVSHAGNAGLARGGSGDLLAGMIASFLAQGLAPYDAARLGCALHGAAADACAGRMGMTPMLPRDMLTDLTLLLKDIRKE